MNIDTNGKDFTDIIPTVAGLTGLSIKDPISILTFYAQHQSILNKIGGFLLSLVKHNQAKKDGTESVPVQPLNIPAPPQYVVPEPKPMTGAIVQSVSAKVFFLEEWQNGPGTATVSSKERFDQVLAGDAVGQGTKIHYNSTPMDASGKEIGPGDPRHDKINNGQPYMQHQIKVDGVESDWFPAGGGLDPVELQAYDKNYGCTCNLKVPAGDIAGRHSVQLRFRVKDSGVVSNWTDVVFVA